MYDFSIHSVGNAAAGKVLCRLKGKVWSSKIRTHQDKPNSLLFVLLIGHKEFGVDQDWYMAVYLTYTANNVLYINLLKILGKVLQFTNLQFNVEQ